MFDNPTRIFSKEAKEERVIEELKKHYQVFHFTGHGVHEPSNPKQSYLALTGNETLTLETLLKLPSKENKLPPLSSYQLVSLSACETAITRNQTITTEYVGLVSGFLCLGVSYVVSSLWTVESGATTTLMIEFYRLFKQGIPETVALAKAQKWLREVTVSELAEEFYPEVIKLIPENKGSIRSILKSELRKCKRMKQENPNY